MYSTQSTHVTWIYNVLGAVFRAFLVQFWVTLPSQVEVKALSKEKDRESEEAGLAPVGLSTGGMCFHPNTEKDPQSKNGISNDINKYQRPKKAV